MIFYINKKGLKISGYILNLILNLENKKMFNWMFIKKFLYSFSLQKIYISLKWDKKLCSKIKI